jgi:DNA-binding NarL/FixJ family response regulator
MLVPQPERAATGRVRVLLADDHAVVREGYRRLLELEPDVAVVGECADGESVRAAIGRGVAVDVLVLDLSMPGCGGLAVLRRARDARPPVQVLVFTMHDSPTMVAQALRAGAAGFVTKNSAPRELVDAVRRVAAGERPVLSPDVAGVAAGDAVRAPLAPREFEVLQLLAQGCSVDEVGRRIHLSAKTVSNYQTAIRQKLGVSTGIELLREARRRGWVGS